MVSNSRPATQNSFSSSQPSVSTQIADSYSDNLIDDLFSDVDRILEGDLSSYITVVGHKPMPINPSTRTVTLPDNFVPRSAAELYHATLSANVESASVESADRRTTGHETGSHAQNAVSYPSGIAFRPPALPGHPQYGGRPVTSGRTVALQTETLQTSRMPKTGQSTLVAPVGTGRMPHQIANDPGIYDAVMAPQTETVQTLPNFAYTDPMPELMLAPVSPRPPQTIFEPQRKPKPQSVSLPFLLVGAASISAVSTLGLWTLSQSEPGHGWLLSLAKEASAAEIPDNSEEEFLAYLQQSLAAISARQAEAQQLSTVIPVAQAATLPTTVPNTNADPQIGALPNLPGIAPPPSVIERIFVPVYENKAETKLASKPLPNVPVPAPVAAAAAIPRGASAPPSVPLVPTNSLPAPRAVAAAPTNAAAAITDSTPSSEHVLVGVLNLGSRSAALFDIEGGSQRAYVGDRIGLSSWNLVSINGQDVVIRRDGEVRSVYIGQKF